MLDKYFAVLKTLNPHGGLKNYPGSPFFVLNRLRQQDQAWLFELHPQDFKSLQANVGKKRQVHLRNSDGFKGLLSLLPPKSRRGLILIDPAYEIKTDYRLVVETLTLAWQKFSSGTYILWYPVVERGQVEFMERLLKKANIADIQQFELGLQPDTVGRGMTSSGVFIINPPWTLYDKMQSLLPTLASALSESNQSVFKCEVLVKES